MIMTTKYHDTYGETASCTWYMTSVQPSREMAWKMVRNAYRMLSNDVMSKLGFSKRVQ